LDASEVRGWLGELLQLSRMEKRSNVEGVRVEELCRAHTHRGTEVLPQPLPLTGHKDQVQLTQKRKTYRD